jgi:hypothetical protein
MLSASPDDRLDHAVKQTSAGFKPESENGSLVEIDHDAIIRDVFFVRLSGDAILGNTRCRQRARAPQRQGTAITVRFI